MNKDKFPIRSPCETCGVAKWRECYNNAQACDKLWDWLAFRGDWVMRQDLIKNRPNLLPQSIVLGRGET